MKSYATLRTQRVGKRKTTAYFNLSTLNFNDMKNGDKSVHALSRLGNEHEPSFGLTKREYFAAMAMQGIMSRVDSSMNEEDLTKAAVQYADELLKQLEP